MHHLPYRPAWEGGQYKGDDNKRQDALRLAMELGADYIDVELQVGISCLFGIHQLFSFLMKVFTFFSSVVLSTTWIYATFSDI